MNEHDRTRVRRHLLLSLLLASCAGGSNTIVDEGITILPENPIPTAPNNGTWQPSCVQKCMQERQPVIYDNAAISIWHHGGFRNHTPHQATSNADVWGAVSSSDNHVGEAMPVLFNQDMI